MWSVWTKAICHIPLLLRCQWLTWKGSPSPAWPQRMWTETTAADHGKEILCTSLKPWTQKRRPQDPALLEISLALDQWNTFSLVRCSGSRHQWEMSVTGGEKETVSWHLLFFRILGSSWRSLPWTSRVDDFFRSFYLTPLLSFSAASFYLSYRFLLLCIW